MTKYMKRVLRYGLIQFVVCTIALTAVKYWMDEQGLLPALLHAATLGLLIAIVNSVIYSKYAAPKYILDAVSVDLDPGEVIQFSSVAKYTSGKEPVGGKLFLTDKRLIFKDHYDDIYTADVSIHLRDISKIDFFNTFLFLNNGLSVHSASGRTEKFIVEKQKGWRKTLDPNRSEWSVASGQ